MENLCIKDPNWAKYQTTQKNRPYGNRENADAYQCKTCCKGTNEIQRYFLCIEGVDKQFSLC